MPVKKAPAHEAAAHARFVTRGMNARQIVAATETAAGMVKSHPEFANKPQVQTAVVAWAASADAVAAADQKANTARTELAAALTTRAVNLAAWRRGTKSMLAAIDNDAGGSEQSIKLWGFPVVTRTASAPVNDAPVGLHARYTKDFALNLRWRAVPANRGYFVQIGDGTPQGWGAPIPTVRATFAPEGLVAGQKISVRVAVQRTHGMSAWSDALALTVR